MDGVLAEDKVLDAAEALFYSRGIQAVGVDDIRTAAGVSLRQIYRVFGTKEKLVSAFLERRDRRWRGRLADYVDATGGDAEDRIFAVFDWLGAWFSEAGFRGCAWINAYGELGGISPTIAEHTLSHKHAFRSYLGELVDDADLPDSLTDELLLLCEGAMVTAAIFSRPDAARVAQSAARSLLAAHSARV